MITSETFRQLFQFVSYVSSYTGKYSPFIPVSRWRTVSFGVLLPFLIATLSQQSLAAQKLEKFSVFSGRWITESSELDRLTRLEIGTNVSVISIHAWAVCQQGECDWGQRATAIATADSGALSATFDFRDRTAALTITPLPDRRLRVACHITYADARPPGDHAQEFNWLSASIPTLGGTTSADAWPAVSQSVVVFFAKQADGELAPVGFGLLVRKNLVATSYGVIKNATNLQARIAAHSEMSAVLDMFKVDEAGDVAVVRVLGLRGWPLGPDDSSQLTEKETVFVMANATAGTLSTVQVSKLGLVRGLPHIETAASFSHTESGSPVFNKFGTVVGISASNPEGANKPGLIVAARRLTALMPELASLPPGNVDSKPKPLNSPMPSYTDEARDRGVQGVVSLRVLIGADGLVKMVKLIRGLPYGLDEQAIKAAYKLKFKPAMKDGQPAAYWMPVLVEFNLGSSRSRPFAVSQ